MWDTKFFLAGLSDFNLALERGYEPFGFVLVLMHKGTTVAIPSPQQEQRPLVGLKKWYNKDEEPWRGPTVSEV